jgi:hypothetical protein
MYLPMTICSIATGKQDKPEDVLAHVILLQPELEDKKSTADRI